MTDLLDRRLKPSPDAMESRVGEETVLLHLESGTYFDPVGTAIWTLLGEGLGLREIRDRIASDYGVEPARVEQDMRSFVEDLLRHGILLDA